MINEVASEQKLLMELFQTSMNKFAGERSFETCLDALNVSIQLAGVRKRMMVAYEQYARILEEEIIKLRRDRGSRNDD